MRFLDLAGTNAVALAAAAWLLDGIYFTGAHLRQPRSATSWSRCWSSR